MPASLIAEFQGTYLGFSPTDESDVGYGEMEVTIDSRSFTVQIATGLEIEKDRFPLTSFQPLPQDEIANRFDAAVASTYAVYSAGHGMSYLFSKDDSTEEPALFVTGGIGDLLGPTFLYSAKQVKRGLFNRALQALEQDFGVAGVMPRLSNRGLALE